MLRYKNLNEVKQEFFTTKVIGTRDYAPRPGYYYIKRVYYRPIPIFGEIAFAEVSWKSMIDDCFIEDFTSQVALTNLFSANPEKTKSMEMKDLEGKVIHVFNPYFVNKLFNGIERKVLNCTWSFVDMKPRFVDKNFGLELFFGDATTLKEACENFVKTANYNVAEAEEQEANPEIYVEEFEDQDHGGLDNYEPDYDGLDENDQEYDDDQDSDGLDNALN